MLIVWWFWFGFDRACKVAILLSILTSCVASAQQLHCLVCVAAVRRLVWQHCSALDSIKLQLVNSHDSATKADSKLHEKGFPCGARHSACSWPYIHVAQQTVAVCMLLSLLNRYIVFVSSPYAPYCWSF